MKQIFFRLFIAIFLLALTSIVSADSAEPVAHQELVLEQQRLAVLNQSNLLRQIRISHLKERIQLIKNSEENIPAQRLRRARMNLIIANTELSTTKTELIGTNKNLKVLQSSLKKLEQRLNESKIAPTENNKIVNAEAINLGLEVEYQANLIKLKQEEINELTRATSLLNSMIELETRLLGALEDKYKKQMRKLRTKELFQTTQDVQSEQQKLLNQLALLNQQAQQFEIKNQTTSSQSVETNLQIFQLQQEIDFGQLKLKLADISDRIDTLFEDMEDNKAVSYNDLSNENRYASSLLTDLNGIKNFISKKTYLINERRSIEKESYSQNIIDVEQYQDHQQSLNQLLNRYKQFQKQFAKLDEKVRLYQESISEQLNKLLKQRRALPDFSEGDAWLKLTKNIIQIPVLLERYLVVLFGSLGEKLHKFSVTQWIILLLLETCLLSFWAWGRKYIAYLSHHINELRKQRVTVTLAYVVIELIKRNLTALLTVAILAIVLLTAGMPFHSYKLLFLLICFWFGYRVVSGIASLLLLENIGDTSGEDVSLYRRLKWLFRIGAVLIALTVLTYQLPVIFEVRNLFIRLCMILLLLFSWIMWKGRDVIPNLVKLYIQGLPNYFLRIVNILCFLIPLVFFTSAAVGLLGYMTLAWEISFYLIVFLFVFAVYVVLRGAWGDLMDFVYDASVRYLKNGWLWSEAILKPIDHVIRFFLILFALAMLFVASGFANDAELIQKLYQLFVSPLFSFLGTKITAKVIFETLIVIAIIFWATRWSREFAYRSLFARVIDKGLRNSLAVFTQYATVIIGFLIILRVLGVDVSGLSVILGGLAVGIGFGLRDFANNFVSGVLLLIERPLRVGDTVSIGGFEGEVIHIGMRSMVIKTWDHMDVVVPNSETFSKSFTNWTRQDNIVRTVISVKISREDNALNVQSIIHETIKYVPEVLVDPAPEVFMKEIGDVLIEFEIRYFIHFTVKMNRSHVRSKVLFAVWKRFDELGIRPPYPSQDIYVRSFPEYPELIDEA